MRYFIIILTILGLGACAKYEPGYSFKVENTLGQPVTVEYRFVEGGFYTDSTYVMNLQASETKTIFMYLDPDDDDIKDILPDTISYFGIFTVTAEDNTTATTDFNKKSEWAFEKEKDYHGIYQLQIDQTDF